MVKIIVGNKEFVCCVEGVHYSAEQLISWSLLLFINRGRAERGILLSEALQTASPLRSIFK